MSPLLTSHILYAFLLDACPSTTAAVKAGMMRLVDLVPASAPKHSQVRDVRWLSEPDVKRGGIFRQASARYSVANVDAVTRVSAQKSPGIFLRFSIAISEIFQDRIHALNNAVLLRSIRKGLLVMDSSKLKELFELIRYIFTASIGSYSS